VGGLSWIRSANLLLGGSKEGKLYLLDANNLGGYNGPSGPDNVLSEIQGTCDQFGPKSGQSGLCALADGAPAYPALAQPANCQGNIIQPAGDAGINPTDGAILPVDGAVNSSGWPINCFYDQQSWPHLHGAPLYWEGGGQWTYYAGQYDFVRAVQIDTTLKKFTSNFAKASQPAPTIGYGGLMSLSVTTANEGVLWVSMQDVKELPVWQDHTLNPKTPADLSFSERAPGALYSLNASPTNGTLTPLAFSDNGAADKSQFLLAKFTPPTVYGGRIYLATFSNEIRTYGHDADGDSVPDRFDNCPTLANADQQNTNEDARSSSHSSAMRAIPTHLLRSRARTLSRTVPMRTLRVTSKLFIQEA
jgi:hypothetical protein